MKIFNKRKNKDLRQRLRSNLPKAESLLWKQLRSRCLEGKKFRRQHGIGDYVVDFYCPEHKLVIEVDGDSHFGPGEEEKDVVRKNFLESQGLNVIRFINHDIYKDMNTVLETIKQNMATPLDSPLGKGGEHFPKLIAILGPTSSGKSSLGIRIAKEIGGEIISVDSRQIYRGMDIVTGKEMGEWDPVREVMVVEGVDHWGIDIAAPDQDFSAADFKEYAEQKIEEIAARGNVPILVGGTGFWLQALIDNFDLTQTAKDDVLRTELEQKSLEELVEMYKALDPEGFETIDTKNKRRLVRAVEVCKVTGKPFSAQQTVGESKYEVLQIGIDVPKDILYERINNRIDVMVGMGLQDEVESMYLQYGSEVPSMTGIGYRQVCKAIDGLTTFEDAITEMKRDSRHYAKRQVTWWKRDDRIKWIAEPEQAENLVKSLLYPQKED